MYISIFDRVKNYKSNPIKEFDKISGFVENTNCTSYHTIETLFDSLFPCSEELSSIYTDYAHCISDCTSNLSEYNLDYNNEQYNYFDDDTKELLLNEFLTFIQIIQTFLNLILKNKNRFMFFKNQEIDFNVFTHLSLLIENSLKCFNYKAVCSNDNFNAEIIKADSIAECVADQSPKNISEAILQYLGSRDLTAKERKLRDFIDLLEPVFKKYKDQKVVSKACEYSQLFRHPETKKNEPQYKWFYNNKSKYIDNVFALCLFSQQYSLSKEIIDEFESNKTI